METTKAESVKRSLMIVPTGRSSGTVVPMANHQESLLFALITSFSRSKDRRRGRGLFNWAFLKVLIARWLNLEPSAIQYFKIGTAAASVLSYEYKTTSEPIIKSLNDRTESR
jgi:hypothetical protein